MSIPPGVNLQKGRLSILHVPEQQTVVPVKAQADEKPSKIERGIRLNPMQREFLKKFEKLQSGARDLSIGFAHLPGDKTAPIRCGLVQIKKISEK